MSFCNSGNLVKHCSHTVIVATQKFCRLNGQKTFHCLFTTKPHAKPSELDIRGIYSTDNVLCAKTWLSNRTLNNACIDGRLIA